jgi:hypothetical protein
MDIEARMVGDPMERQRAIHGTRPVHMGVRPVRKNRAPNFSRALFFSLLYYHATYQLGKMQRHN